MVNPPRNNTIIKINVSFNMFVSFVRRTYCNMEIHLKQIPKAATTLLHGQINFKIFAASC